MEPALKVVTHLPLTELWNDRGLVEAQRVTDLDAADIQNLLQSTNTEFVVADIGQALKWISDNDRFRVWKEEVRPRLAHPGRFRLEDYPGQYCYAASRWQVANGSSVIVFEKNH